MSAQPEMTYSDDEYLAIDRASETKYEMLHHEIYSMAGASGNHNRITFNVNGTMGVQLRGKPCSGFSSDMRLKIRRGTYYYPDITVVCGDTEIVKDSYKDTLLNPTLVVEVLSPSTADFDQTKKFADYRTLSSLQEVVFISQDVRRIARYLRGENGDWLFREITQRGETIDLSSIGCTLAVDDVYDKVDIEEDPEAAQIVSTGE